MQVTIVAADQYTMDKSFQWVLILLMTITLQYLFTIYLFTMPARIRAFTADFMAQFDKEHSEAFPGKDKAPQQGYPDNGNGRYASKLSYGDWYRMNNGQRCQVNFLEHITFVLVSGLIAGLCYPNATIGILSAVFVGRLLFSIGYTKCGPSARVPGALTMDLGILVGLGFMIASCIKLWTDLQPV